MEFAPGEISALYVKIWDDFQNRVLDILTSPSTAGIFDNSQAIWKAVVNGPSIGTYLDIRIIRDAFITSCVVNRLPRDKLNSFTETARGRELP